MTAPPLGRRIVVAALQGVLLWWLYAALDAGRWPATASGVYVALVTVGVLVPGLGYLMSDLAGPLRRRWGILATATAVLLLLGWHQGTYVSGPLVGQPNAGESTPDAFSFTLPVLLLCAHALPFAQVFMIHGDWHGRYPELFRLAWRNALLVALALLFCGAFWLLLGLWAQLFNMLGVRLFSRIFFDSKFAIPATAVVIGSGIQLAGSVERLETALREQILRLLKWLAPLAALLLGVFSVALLVKSPELLAAKQRVISAAWLLWLVATNVLLLNAAYQDGEGVEPYPPWLGQAIRWVVPLLGVVTAIAAYAIAVRVDEYGLTTSRVWAVLVAVLAIAYAAGYAWAALRGGRWMAGMGHVNVMVALLTIGCLTLLLTPLLSPYRLAASSQFDRILAAGIPEGDAAVIDRFITLRFDNGRYGRERLARLARLDGHAQADDIRRLAGAVQAQTARYLARDNIERVATPELSLNAYPAGASIESSLREAIARAFVGGTAPQSCRSDPCQVLFADMNADGAEEAIVFGAATGGLLLRRDGSGWHPAGSLQPREWTPPELMRDLLQKGEVRVVEPEWSVLMLGDRAFRYREPDPTASPAGMTP